MYTRSNTLAVSSFLTIGLFAHAAAAQGVLQIITPPPHPTGKSGIGARLAPAGDIDGDGFDDIIIGSFLADSNGKTHNGAARVVSGKTGSLIYYMTGAISDEECGRDVAGGFDINGDGHPDFAVAYPGAGGNGTSGAGPGNVRVYSGTTGVQILLIQSPAPVYNGAFGTSFDVADVNLDGTIDFIVGEPNSNAAGTYTGAVGAFNGKNGVAIWNWSIPVINEGLGYRVRSLGDVLGDGIPDFAASAPYFDGNKGIIYELSGADGSYINTFLGTVDGEWFGGAFAAAGDVDKDATMDLIIGKPIDSTKGAYAGSATVYNGWHGGVIKTVYGGTNFEMGDSVGAAHDVNGDGYDDFVVGAPGAGNIFPNVPLSGSCWLYSGKTGNVIISEFGPAANAYSGFSVGYVGDVNHDGKPDFAMGSADFNNGEGCVQVFSGSNFSQLYLIRDDSINAQLGASVAIVGDVDGDGVADVLAGSPGEIINNRLNVGAARLYSGATGALLRTATGSNVNDRFGAAVAAIGDVNGDGVPDYAISEPGYDSGAFSFNTGALFVYSGQSGLVIRLIVGNPNEFLGYAAAGAGDVNKDGVPDLITGSPLANANGGLSGRVNVWSGANGASLYNWSGNSAGAQFGTSVAGAGDLNQDGYADVIAGAPHETFISVDNGVARTYSGKTGFVLGMFIEVPGGALCGTSVAGGGDVDGDGTPDVIVGAPNLNANNLGACGVVRVYSGATNVLIYSMYGTAAGAHLGASVAFAGDVNNDGRADFAAGAPDYNNSPGGATGCVNVYSGVDASKMYTFLGNAQNQRFGAAIAGGGDLNHNNFGDLVAGAPFANNSGPVSGMVQFLSLFPIGVQIYGNGTPGCSGAQLSFTGSVPATGNADFSFTCNHVPNNTLSLGLVTDAPDANGSDPLGVGCVFLVGLSNATEIIALDMVSDNTGHGYVKVAVPNNASLIGKNYYYQTISYWAGACPLGSMSLSSSSGLKLTIQ
ncbi:MAG: FG-GAP repeat protein [Planctomycetes bacterium]|nr:FG-GAP repeat protein [Planctomycetota bacterium]